MLRLSDFSIQELFTAEAIELYANPEHDIMAKEDKKNPIYDNNHKKRALHLEDNNSSEQPFKKKSVDSAALHLKNNDTYKRRKKKKDEEKHWKIHGHLPKTSTKKKLR